MPRKLFVFFFALVLTILFALLPIFPYLSETREILEDGESLYQMWSFVTLPEFYDSARFAKAGWLDSTWNNYLILFALNHVGLVLVFFAVRNILNLFLGRNK